jgi:hypothetical protein
VDNATASCRWSGGFYTGRRLVRLPAIGLASGLPVLARWEPLACEVSELLVVVDHHEPDPVAGSGHVDLEVNAAGQAGLTWADRIVMIVPGPWHRRGPSNAGGPGIEASEFPPRWLPETAAPGLGLPWRLCTGIDCATYLTIAHIAGGD